MDVYWLVEIAFGSVIFTCCNIGVAREAPQSVDPYSMARRNANGRIKFGWGLNLWSRYQMNHLKWWMIHRTRWMFPFRTADAAKLTYTHSGYRVNLVLIFPGPLEAYLAVRERLSLWSDRWSGAHIICDGVPGWAVHTQIRSTGVTAQAADSGVDCFDIALRKVPVQIPPKINCIQSPAELLLEAPCMWRHVEILFGSVLLAPV